MELGEEEKADNELKEVDWVEEYFQEQKEKDVVNKAKEKELEKAKQKERLDFENPLFHYLFSPC